jgi:poly-beta-1,6-N-acetyl-D-glucosamine biosynthesis protein PgaD
VKWRDILLTSMMWGFFAILLDAEFELFLGDYLEQLGLGPFDTNANWLVFFELLMPFLLIAAILAGALIIFSLRTLRRRSRALHLPQPAPLETTDQAQRAGLDEVELIAARDQRIVIVHIDDNGRHRIEAPQQQ